MRYNNYHKHDHASNIFSPDCNVKAEDYIKKSLEYGHTNYFTTNHGHMGDIFEARTLCDKYGIRCLAGMEGYIVSDPLWEDEKGNKDKSNYHIIIIPTTDKARKKLNVVSSRANIYGYYYRPRIFISDLLKLDKEDVYITTACIAGLLKDENSIETILFPLIEHFQDHVLLEVQSHNDEGQIAVNKKAVAMSQDILDFPTAEIMFDRFRQQGVLTENQIEESIKNTLIFDECEEIQLDHEIKMPTIYPDLTPRERYELLESMVYEKFEKIAEEEDIVGEEKQKYIDGIKYELKIVEDTNEVIHTADYFLFNTKMVDLAVNKYGGVLTRGGRGSGGSFYINKVLGMTQLDRFKINLPIFPDRFASTARLLENRALPDFDFNCKEQEPFVKATRELLGENGCYPMYAPGTMQLSEAFRNVCRSKGMDYDEFNDVGKNIEKYAEDKKWKPIIEEAKKYVDTIVSGSVHPCAHLLSNKNILEEYGVVRLGGNVCVIITSSEADEYKVLKNDYLIVKVWKLISETFDLIGEPILSAKQLLSKIKDDKRIWDLFKNGITCTLNQVDSDNGMEQAKKYGISSFEEGAYVAAAIRPSFDAWRDNFLNRRPYSTGSKYLDDILSMTHGYILFQENLMQYFEALGVTPAESIGLIKKISKKKIKPEDFANLEDRLRENWVKQTRSDDGFDTSWDMIQGCMSYGFASPHAAATSLDMCYGAYLKVNYPLEYYTVCFNNYSDDMVRTAKLKKELDYFGIKLGDIKFRHSRGEYSFNTEERIIYKGIASIKYLTGKVAEELYALKDKKYDSFVDVLYDLEEMSINTRQLEILIKLDFFSEFGDINYLLEVAEVFEKIHDKKILKKKNIEGYEELARECADSETAAQYKLSPEGMRKFIKAYSKQINVPQATLGERLKYKQELLGYIDYKNPDLNTRCAFVASVDAKYSPKIDLYCLKTGEVSRVKVYKSKPFKNNKVKTTFKDTPLEVGNIIWLSNCSKEPKRRKNADGEWVDSPNEYEWWLTDYRILDEVC